MNLLLLGLDEKPLLSISNELEHSYVFRSECGTRSRENCAQYRQLIGYTRKNEFDIWSLLLWRLLHDCEELESIFQSHNNRSMNVLQTTIYNDFMLVNIYFLCKACKSQRKSNGQLPSQSSFLIFVSTFLLTFGYVQEKKNIFARSHTSRFKCTSTMMCLYCDFNSQKASRSLRKSRSTAWGKDVRRENNKSKCDKITRAYHEFLICGTLSAF